MRIYALQEIPLLLSVAALLIALIFAVDTLTPLGYVEWILYVVPTALCLFVGQAAAPLFAAVACSVLLVAGYIVSPVGMDGTVTMVNRIFGAIVIWVVAIVGSRFITVRTEIERLTWLAQGKALVSARLAGVQRPEDIGSHVLATLVEYTKCVTGVFYRLQDGHLRRIASSALSVEAAAQFPVGHGLTGQVAIEGRARIIGPLAENYLALGSGLGKMMPRAVMVTPTLVDGTVNGVLEVAYLEQPERLVLTGELIQSCAETIGVALNAAISRIRLQELLDETQRQAWNSRRSRLPAPPTE